MGNALFSYSYSPVWPAALRRRVLLLNTLASKRRHGVFSTPLKDRTAFAKAEIICRPEDPPPRIVDGLAPLKSSGIPTFHIVRCNLLHSWLLCMPYARVAGACVGQPYNFRIGALLADARSRNYFCQRKLLTMRILCINARIEQQEV